LYGRSLVGRGRHFLVGAVRLGLVRFAEEGLYRGSKFARPGFHCGSRCRSINDGWRCPTSLGQHDADYPRRKAVTWRVAALADDFVKNKIQDDLKAAMKSGDKLRMMALRSVLSEISRLEKDVRRDPNDAEILQIIKRERAKREESLEFARKAARQDLIEQNETEAKILESYLPAATSADEVRAEIAAAIAAGASQMGPIMKALRDKFGAGLDGKTASELAKEALAKK
jgi:uncharacterized protein YqeY